VLGTLCFRIYEGGADWVVFSVLPDCKYTHETDKNMEISKYTINDLLTQGPSMIDGYLKLSPTVELPELLGETARSSYLGLEEADSELRHLVALHEIELSPALQDAFQVAGAIIKADAKILQVKEGERWTAMYGQHGFLNESTRVPDKAEARLLQLGVLAKFLGKNPAAENEALGVTAAKAKAAAKNLKTAMGELTTNEQAQQALEAKCERLASQLRKRLRTLIGELKEVLSQDDPRWEELNLVTPATHRAGKAARDRKAKKKSEARAEGAVASARRRAEASKAGLEKARIRMEEAQAAFLKLQAAVEASAAKTAALFEKADALEAKLKTTLVVLPTADRTESVAQASVVGTSAILAA